MIEIFVVQIKKYRLHLTIWGLFILYETILASAIFGVDVNPIVYGAHYLVIISFFYLNSSWFLPSIFKQKYAQLIALIGLSIVVILYVLSQFFVAIFLYKLGLDGRKELNLSFILTNAYRGIFFIGLSSGYFFVQRFFRERKINQELEKARLNSIILQQKIQNELTIAQNAFLKSQINPHFLFNTLDFVYHEVNSSSPKAGETIISLSNMMRYALDAEQQGEQVRLVDEINQLEDLIRIYRLRNEQLQLELVYDQEVTHLRIIPLVLLTLAENMFKHGLLNQSDNPARIQIELIDDQLQINTRNLVGRSGGSSHQQGLENIRKRLEQAYGSDSCLTYGVSNGMFELRLSIAVERMR